MRIAQLVNRVQPAYGGVSRAVDRLGQGYAERGHTRLVIRPGAEDTVETTAAGTVVTIASPTRVSGHRIITNLRKVAQVLDRFGPDSVEVSDKATLAASCLWARRRGVGSVLVSHERLDDLASLFLELEVSREVHVLNRWLARTYDKIVVTTRYSAGEWINTKAKLAVVPFGVDVSQFADRNGPREPGTALRLIHVGRLSREKSPHLAVATAVELERRGVDVQLNVYGAGPHADELRTLAGGAPVFFHGYVDSRAALAAEYRAADIALSVCPAEAFGLAALEALACGTPVVTADRGGARELVDASCAEWGSPDPVFLADAVQRLAARLGRDEAGVRQAARACAERYPWETAITAMLAVHQQVAG